MDHYDVTPARSWRLHSGRTKGWNQEGRLLSWSVVYSGPTGLVEKTPYVIGLIEFDNGEQIVCQMAEVVLDDLWVGMRCVGKIRRLFISSIDQLIPYGVKFMPVWEKDSGHE